MEVLFFILGRLEKKLKLPMDKNLNGASELILSIYGYTDHVVLAANFFYYGSSVSSKLEWETITFSARAAKQ